ncbi:phosphopantetheine-binding protein [Moorena sp. SIO3H5]|uniref:phosphopantetheine-binding protein n=1 Tax=Moorena sp. SIO3H5 TaxID=2607834 RepID=UPI0013BB774E|nr:phosphopantetheine-binding protein [Moorena sp. SIO3H5]NEO71692.1 acyl carrier protein [Moorena sp. SIO3H5]
MSNSKELAISDVVVPQTETEKQLAEIWKDVLSVETISIEDRFMDIGGNSINLIEVVNQVTEKMGVSIKARLFFDKHKSTIAELSKEIDAIRGQTY